MSRLKKHLIEWLLDKRYKFDFNPATAKKILVLRNDRIGDMIVSTALLRELKAAYPALIIDVVASDINHDIVRDCPHIRHLMRWNKKGGMATLRTMLRIRRERYDAILSTSLQFSPAFQLSLKVLGARHLAGFTINKYGTSTARLGMYDHTVECISDRHILENYFAALDGFKLANIDYRYELYGVDGYAQKARDFVAALGGRHQGLICFNYQGSNASRTLGTEDAAALCAQLAQRYPDRAVIVIYPPADRERAAAIVAASGQANVLLSFETQHILELAALVRECDIVISPDTAVIHLASVYNKKVLGFYINSGNHRWFYPMCDHYRILLSPTERIDAIDRAATLAAFDELMAA